MILYIFSLLGVAVSAISGALTAGRKRFDLVGVAVIAMVTALGGGTIRDVLLNRHPVFWIDRADYLLVILGASALTIIYVRFSKPPYSALLVADALGLALFTITGAQVSEQQGVPAIVTVLMATITGSAGGVIRDILTAEVPLLFQRSALYATTSVAGATAYVALHALHVPQPAAAVVGMSLVALLRLAAIYWNLQLPVFEVLEEDQRKEE